MTLNHIATVTQTLADKTATEIAVLNQPNPVNIATGNEYQNSNKEKLKQAAANKGYTSHEWGTMKQWNAGYQTVAKGSKGTRITFYKKEIVEGVITQVLNHAFVYNRCQLVSAQKAETENNA